jgi:hypothetical protein
MTGLNAVERKFVHNRRVDMVQVRKISAKDAKAAIGSNMGLLVCIYDDVKFNSGAHLEGAIPMSEFEKLKPDLTKDTNIIFY